MKRNRVKPLYRKLNHRALWSWPKQDGDARHSRHTKKGMNTSMKKNVKWGLDYNPLFHFLLSKVGQPFDKVHSEAVSRLDKEEPIWWMVCKTPEEYESAKLRPYFNYGESSMFSKLYVDEEGILQKIDTELSGKDFKGVLEHYYMYTFTFNGKVLKRQKT